ncbi:MAG: cardiolipin synthase [Syntrophales bacterium]|nr:cardiolipin synthase [Syntrophales bacterium]MDD4339530.1 cardiolipin synthase [Syntrophales bacterium]HOG07470.1 cardiolipin synthase [Syntrophales bacterium]HOS76588.1 cardiolipin synthase [Syntrophales bacterium]HPB70578.1 cardiolipin synthase [Syntrophales bacterium]
MNTLDTLMAGLAFVVAMVSSLHALFLKRDPKSAIGWITVCVLIPFAGPFLYYLFGINRVRTRAEKLQRRAGSKQKGATPRADRQTSSPEGSAGIKDPSDRPSFARVSDILTDRPLVDGNRIEALHSGEEAYPAMLEAIDGARRTLFLTTYIFERNRTGKAFVDALLRAAERGVDLRVIIDGLSDVFHLRWASRRLKKSGVPVARFLPPRLIPPTALINLRNHRKILVADGQIGFTGGINIGDSYLAGRHDNPHRVVDLHFRLKGPVVRQIEEVFIDDWGFITGTYESVAAAESAPVGSARCRVITGGPNEDMDKLAMILTAAVAAARTSVVIMTPYFIPPRGLLVALQTAALRGLRVSIVLPEKSDSRVVHWATRNLLWELLERGVRVYYQPPPFVHTKLVIVDDGYVHIGSANIDPRSLRLNFELNVEIFDKPLTGTLTRDVKAVIQKSRAVTLDELDGRPFPVKLRDSLAWLLSPYL